ncbi:MAG TPA: LptF/LptG family permease [Myxococcales bacterium]|nr:LptF/LptG family permease [Myxococcales bacterium]
MRLPLADRIVLREMGMPLAAGLFAILQLLVVAQLLQLNEVVFSSAITLRDLGRVTAAFAPHFLVMAVPLAYMLGLQLGVGRLAADRELLALATAGQSPLRLYRVPCMLALALALCVAALARWAEPWGLQEVNRVLNGVIKRSLKSGLLPGVFNDALPRFMVYVSGDDRGTWKGVLIEDEVGDGAPLLALAESGHVEDAGGEALALRLYRGELHRSEPKGETVARFSEGSFLVGVQDPVARQNRLMGTESALSDAQLRQRVEELLRQGKRRDAVRFQLEVVRRRAVPLVCVLFAILAVPLAVVARGVRGSAYLVTLGVFVAFYVLSRLAVALAENGVNAWVAGLMPDAAVLVVGLLYTAALIRRGVGKPA